MAFNIKITTHGHHRQIPRKSKEQLAQNRCSNMVATATGKSGCALTAGTGLPVTTVSTTDGSRKRVLTEARREQNRVNQRNFRQKQRAERREGLPTRCQRTSAKKLNLQACPTIYRANDIPITLEPTRALENPVLTSIHMRSQEMSQSNNVATQLLSPFGSSCTFSNELHLISDREGITELLSDMPSTSDPLSSGVDSNSTSLPRLSEFECLQRQRDVDVETLVRVEESPTLDPQDPRYISDVGQSWSPTQNIPLLPPDIPMELPLDDSRDYQNGHNQALTNLSFDLENVIAAGLEVLLSGRRPVATSEYMSSPSWLPNPRTNCLQFYPNKVVLACIQNAVSMGFLAQDVMMPRCFAPSPFHRLVTPADDPKALLAAVTRPTTPANLRPTLPQLLFPHPAFMDLIPMPLFRARAITLAATQPHVLNMGELKKDRVVEEGLVLWTSSACATSNRRSGGRGQPWDIRSWEAAPWFLRKWRMLVDGEDGEVWKQSMWWQQARGDGVDGRFE